MADRPVTQSMKIAERERRTNRGHPQLHFGLARDLQEVTTAWHLTYEAYRDKGLIHPNPYHIHTSTCAIDPQTAVVLGRLDGQAICTLTTMHDSEQGLPLDSVYARELDQLRLQGRDLVEVGMLADRRENPLGAMPTVLEMMRFAYFRAYHYATDIVAGVHPHHVGFYKRFLSFEEIGEATTHPGVNHHPVVLLRLNVHEKANAARLAKGTRMFHRRPLDPQVFDRRVRLSSGYIAGTMVEDYLDHKRARTALPASASA